MKGILGREAMAIAVAVLFGAVALPVYAGSAQSADNKQQQSAQNPTQISAADLAANPSQYYGKTVRIQSDVSNVYGPHTFTLGKKGDNKPEILVLNPSPLRAPNQNETLTAIGTVRKYMQADITREYAWFGNEQKVATPEVAALIAEMPVLIVNQLKAPDGQELVQAGSNPNRAGDVPESTGSVKSGTDSGKQPNAATGSAGTNPHSGNSGNRPNAATGSAGTNTNTQPQ